MTTKLYPAQICLASWLNVDFTMKILKTSFFYYKYIVLLRGINYCLHFVNIVLISCCVFTLKSCRLQLYKWNTGFWFLCHSELDVMKLVSRCLPCSCRLFDSSEEQVEESEEDRPEVVSPQPAGQSYAATVALPSTSPSSTTLLGTVVLIINWWKPLEGNTS